MFSSLRCIKFLGWCTIILGSLILSITMFRSGQKYPFGLGFWGPNGHDAIWHISVINQMKFGLPPPNPIFSGTELTRYHWGFNLFAYLLNRIIPISIMTIYFRVIPIIFAFIIGILSYILVYNFTQNHFHSSLFILFNYFTSSFGWLVTLFKNHTIAGESLFWSMQSASTLINPPYAMSLIIILLVLLLWQQKRTKNIAWAFLIGFILGLLTGIKIYAAISFGLSFFLFYLIRLFQNKKIFSFEFYLCVSMVLTSLVIMLSLGLFSPQSLLVFKPFWFVHSMIESPDKFFLPKLAALRYNLSFQLFSYKLPFILALEIALLIIFIVGNLGFRIIGFHQIVKTIKLKNISPEDLLLLLVITVCLLLPTIFIQKGTSWNTIQFLYYFLFLFNFYLAQTLVGLYKIHSSLAVIIIILSVIGSYGTLKDYLGYPPPAAVPNYELEALDYLKKQPPGIVLSQPYDKHKKGNQPTPLPLYLYETTAYVSALTGFQGYLEDEMNLDITGYDWLTRRREALKFFDQKDKEIFENRGFLLNNHIQYVYLSNPPLPVLNTKDLQLEKIFDNVHCQIYQVEK